MPSPPVLHDDELAIAQVARRLDEPEAKVYRWIREGRIIAIWRGGRLRVRRSEVEYIVENGTRPRRLSRATERNVQQRLATNEKV